MSDSESEDEILDYSLFRESHEMPLDDLWNSNLPLSQNFMNLIDETVALPYPDLQIPVITAYALIPSALASIVPILFVYGEQGTGKSDLGILISGLHKSNIMSAASTFAGTRTYFNEIRWAIPALCEGEKNCCLIFDNVNKETLNDEQLYTFLLNGYNRKTDKISISKGNGENMNFRIFGLKVLSSIHPLFLYSQFGELTRRCLIIKCKSFKKLTSDELVTKLFKPKHSILNKISPEDMNLSILNEEFQELWRCKKTLLEYVRIKRELTSRKKSFNIPSSFDGGKWTISVDLLTTGIITEIWKSINEAINFLGEYWQWVNDGLLIQSSATKQLLKDFIYAETKDVIGINEELGYEAIRSNEIKPDKLKNYVAWAESQGMLESKPNATSIAEIMQDLGWVLDKGSNSQICWVQNTN